MQILIDKIDNCIGKNIFVMLRVKSQESKDFWKILFICWSNCFHANSLLPVLLRFLWH